MSIPAMAAELSDLPPWSKRHVSLKVDRYAMTRAHARRAAECRAIITTIETQIQPLQRQLEQEKQKLDLIQDADAQQTSQELSFLDTIHWLMDGSDVDYDKTIVLLDPGRHDASLNKVVVTSVDVPSQSIHFADPDVQTQWNGLRHWLYIDAGDSTYGYRHGRGGAIEGWTVNGCDRNPIGLHGNNIVNFDQRIGYDRRFNIGKYDNGEKTMHLIKADQLGQTVGKLGDVYSMNPVCAVRVKYQLICLRRRTIPIPANASNDLIEWSYRMEKLRSEKDDLVWFTPESTMEWQNLVPSHSIDGFNIAYRDSEVQDVWASIRDRYIVERRSVKVVFSFAGGWYVNRHLSDNCRIFEDSGRWVVPPVKKEVDVTRPYVLPSIDGWVKSKWPQVHHDAQRDGSGTVPNQTSYFDVLVIKRRPRVDNDETEQSE
jgi:hypothetical protein